MVTKRKYLRFFLLSLVFLFCPIFSAHANVLYSQLDDSAVLDGTSVASSPSVSFFDATGHIINLKFAYNDSGNLSDHYISVYILVKSSNFDPKKL